MSATRTSAEMEQSVSTHSGRSTVTVQRGTRVSFVMIKQLMIWVTTRSYSMNNTHKILLNILKYNPKSTSF